MRLQSGGIAGPRLLDLKGFICMGSFENINCEPIRHTFHRSEVIIWGCSLQYHLGRPFQVLPTYDKAVI